MPNSNYVKGRRKEYAIVKDLKDEGFHIAQRSAGSHSPIDVFAINKRTKTIKFVQSKPDNFSTRETKKLINELNYLNGVWKVEFELR